MQLATWLRPTDTLGAIRSGASLGLQMRQQAAQEDQAAAALRQREDELFAQNERAKEVLNERKNEAANELLKLYGDSVVTSPGGGIDIPASAASMRARGDKDAMQALMGFERALSIGNQPESVSSTPTNPNGVMGQSRSGLMRPASAALVSPTPSMPSTAGLTAPGAAAYMKAAIPMMELQSKARSEQAANARMVAAADLAHQDRLAAIEGRKDALDKNIASREKLAGTKPATLNVGERTLVSNYGRSVANKELAKAQIDDKLVTLENESIPYPVRFAAAEELFKTLNSSDFGRDALQKEETDRIGQLLKFSGPAQWIKSGKKPLPDWEGFLQQIKIKSADLEKQTSVLKAQMDGIQSAAEKRRGDAGGGPVAGAAGKTVDVETARRFLQQAGGNRAAAQKLAREAGYNVP